jgi:hypothetical protein
MGLFESGRKTKQMFNLNKCLIKFLLKNGWEWATETGPSDAV